MALDEPGTPGDDDGEPAAICRFAAPGSSAVTACSASSCSTAVASTRARAARNCSRYFTSYKEQAGDADLVLMGVKLMQLPEVPWVRFAGLLSERERLEALEAATIVVVPSPFESLSLLALEAMAVGTPVLVNGHSEVLVEHCRRSQAGLWYTDRDEFVEAAKLLLADDRLRRTMGRNGKEYVKREYRWDVIMAKYDRLIAAVRQRGGRSE